MTKSFIASFIFCFTLYSITLSGQDKRISTKTIGGKTVLSFQNSRGSIIKSFIVEDENPYRLKNQHGNRASTGDEQWISTQSAVSNLTDSAVATLHSVKVYKNQDRIQESGESTLSVYNHEGVNIFSSKIKADNAMTPLVAPNQKYVAVSFGGLVHDGETLKVGFSIYDLATKKIKLDFPTDDIAHAWTVGDLFIFAAPQGAFSQTRTYYIFDTINDVLYSKNYNRRELNLIKRFEVEGVVFLLPPDAERLERYDEYFIVVR